MGSLTAKNKSKSTISFHFRPLEGVEWLSAQHIILLGFDEATSAPIYSIFTESRRLRTYQAMVN